MEPVLNKLVDGFKEKVIQLIENCRNRGIIMQPYFTLRDPFTQGKLWRQSRTSIEIAKKIEGDITSTPQDLNVFINALFNGKFIKKETLDMMISNKNEKFFGPGIMKMPFYNIISYGHGGDTAGSHSTLAFEPVDKLSFSVIINGQRFPHNSFFVALLNLIYGRDYKYPAFNDTKIPSSELEKYIGEYSSKDIELGLKVFIKDETLYAQGTNQPEFALTAVDKDQFIFEKASLKLVFLPEDNQLKLTQGGKTYLFNKK